MNLELKHLAPYLPYGLKVMYNATPHLMTTQLLEQASHWMTIGYAIESQSKPILRPLSDLTKEIEHNGKTFIPYTEMEWEDVDPMEAFNINFNFRTEIACPLFIWQLLFEWHFDVFGLIEKGLAIDINTLKDG
jgi:hypothetical protein